MGTKNHPTDARPIRITPTTIDFSRTKRKIVTTIKMR
jgi:hypothetical protein